MHVFRDLCFFPFTIIILAHLSHAVPSRLFSTGSHKDRLGVASTKWKFDFQNTYSDENPSIAPPIEHSDENAPPRPSITHLRPPTKRSADLTTLPKGEVSQKDIICGFSIVYNNLDISALILSQAEYKFLATFHLRKHLDHVNQFHRYLPFQKSVFHLRRSPSINIARRRDSCWWLVEEVVKKMQGPVGAD